MDGFNTFEKQDKVLLGLNSGSDAAAAMRILRQQGFAVQTFTAEHEVTPAVLLQLLADKAFQQIALAMAQNHDAPLQHQDIDMYLDRLENARPLDEKVRQMDDSQFSDFFANMGKKKGAKAEEPEE